MAFRDKLKDGTVRYTGYVPTIPTPPVIPTPLDSYPIGAIFLSVVNTSPTTLFGGTWAVFGTGRVLVGVDTGQTEFDTVEETGGAKTVALTEAQLAIHNHDGYSMAMSKTNAVSTSGGTVDNGGNSVAAGTAAGRYNASQTATGSTSNAGSGQAHNNLQPYITCYMWKRTA